MPASSGDHRSPDEDQQDSAGGQQQSLEDQQAPAPMVDMLYEYGPSARDAPKPRGYGPRMRYGPRGQVFRYRLGLRNPYQYRPPPTQPGTRAAQQDTVESRDAPQESRKEPRRDRARSSNGEKPSSDIEQPSYAGIDHSYSEQAQRSLIDRSFQEDIDNAVDSFYAADSGAVYGSVEHDDGTIDQGARQANRGRRARLLHVPTNESADGDSGADGGNEDGSEGVGDTELGNGAGEGGYCSDEGNEGVSEGDEDGDESAGRGYEGDDEDDDDEEGEEDRREEEGFAMDCREDGTY